MTEKTLQERTGLQLADDLKPREAPEPVTLAGWRKLRDVLENEITELKGRVQTLEDEQIEAEIDEHSEQDELVDATADNEELQGKLDEIGLELGCPVHLTPIEAIRRMKEENERLKRQVERAAAIAAVMAV